MCGIVGLISKRQSGFWPKELSIFKAMLVNDAQRGEDSTGAFSAYRDGTATAIKAATIPHLLYMSKEWDKFEKKGTAEGRFLVGHNRKATKGQISSYNAHPFREGNTIMVHNGTLNNYASWKTDKDVDSHALCEMIDKHGHEEILPKIEGAYALAWYNTKTEKLYLCRNKERPLYLVIAEDVIAFASESWMAYGQLMREDHKVKEGFLLEPGTLYEFDLSGNMTTSLFKPFTYVAQTSTMLDRGRDWVTNRRPWSPINDDGEDIPAVYLGRDILDRPTTFPGNKLTQYKDNDTVQVAIHRILNERPGQPQPYKAIGSVVEAGKQTIDFVGYLPMGVDPVDWPKWINTPVTAVILRTTNSNCGPSIFGISLKIDELVETFNAYVGKHTWTQVTENECCSKCGTFIEEHDHEFTSINSKKNDFRVHCHKCILANLKGDMKNDFIHRRVAALQKGQSVVESTVKSPQSAILLAGAPTVH